MTVLLVSSQLPAFPLAPLSFAGVTFFAYDIPGLYQKDGGGVYDKIVSKLIVDEGTGKLKVLPGIRAENSFANCQNCCITPANTNPAFYDFGSDVVATEPMNNAEIYIFSKRGAPPIDNVDDLAGKRVGIREGMATSLSSVLDGADFKVQGVRSIEQNMQKLDKGRIKAYIDFVPDVYLVANDLGVEAHPHSKGKPLQRHPDSLACKGVSPEFITDFNRKLSSMRDNGELLEILGDSIID
ncbi:MAG: substrate-binding periplasmic protein [Granulosicoccus sp.]